MKTRNKPLVSIPEPTDVMWRMVSDCKKPIGALFEHALSIGARNEWMVFIVAIYDARTRLYFDMSRRPDNVRAELVNTHAGRTLVSMMPVQCCDHPSMQAHPYFQPVRKLNRATIGTDCIVVSYAHGQIFAGTLQANFGIRVVSHVVSDDKRERMEAFCHQLVPNLRAVLPADAMRLNCTPSEVAYSVNVARNRDSRRHLNETEFDEMGTSGLLTSIDTYTIGRFIEMYAEEYKDHPEVAAFLSVPVEPGCFRVMVQLFGNIGVFDYPVVNPHSIEMEPPGTLS